MNCMRKPDYKKEVADIMRSKVTPEIMRQRLSVYHDNDVAEALKELNTTERKLLYRVLSTEKLADIFEYVDEADAGVYLGEMDKYKAATVIAGQDADAAVDILRAMDKDEKNQLIAMMDEESRQDIKLIASFDEDEIGSRMSTNYIAFGQNLLVKEAMRELMEQAADNDNISTLFVIDEKGILRGAIDLKRLITAKQERPVMMLAATSFPFVYGHEDTTDCLERLKDYSENSIPVLDNDNRLIGVITSQNIIEVVDDEMGDDYAKFAGLTAEEELGEPLLDSMKKRMPWLLALFVLGMFVSSIIGLFENVVSELPLIMVFQTLILDMSGNAGTQSLAVTLQVLTDPEVKGKKLFQLFLKEARVAFVNGLLINIMSFVLIGAYFVVIKKAPVDLAFIISGCISIAMLLAMVISSIFGTVVPLIFNRLDLDPAVASGPLITTMNDLIAVVIYYSMCWILLIRMLGLGG